MKKLLALVLAAMMLCVTFGALAEYPAVVEGIDFGGAEVQVLDYWSGDGARTGRSVCVPRLDQRHLQREHPPAAGRRLGHLRRGND